MDYLQSFPPQITHTPYPHHYYPSWVPPQTNVEATKPSAVFEPWAYGSIYARPNATECHSCCNHSYPTGYYAFRPPHSHLPPPPPPPQFYYHGPYSPYANTFPPHYAPTHYPMEHPRFVIDKSMPETHCCGCPNHKCDGMKATGVKIEEPDSEVRVKASEPLGLPHIKNYPNPVVWVPPELTNGVDKPSESDPRLWNGWFPYNMKKNQDSGKSLESEPKVWNGWIPLDMNSLKFLKQGEHEAEKQTEEKKELIPQHPILWVPVLDKSEEAEKRDLKEDEASTKDSEQQPMKYTIIPLKFPYNDNCGLQAGPVEDTCAAIQSKAKEDKVEHKSIPVVQMEDRRERNTLEDSQKKTKSIPVKEAGDQIDKKPSSDKIAKRQSPSPPKATKLPPVCLRVDPLPRRKSRSPSPPSKENVVKKVDSISKVPSSPTMEKVQQEPSMQDVVSNKENDLNSKNQESKVVEVVEGTSARSKKEDTRKLDHVQIPVNVPVISNEETITEIAELREKDNEVGKGANEEPEETSKEAVKEKKEFSPTEAAVQIQSMYRGYEVRRLEPLKKLRQIARVREQVEEVRKQIASLESSNMQNIEKQKLLIGETIMSLLLQLDTIQGLHSSVRDIRKSVARELIFLQEKLDSLNSQMVVGQESKEADVMCIVPPAKEEDKCEAGHATEHISIEATDKPKDLILEEDESNGSSNESGQYHLEISCSAVEEADQQLVDIETKVDTVKRQPIDSAMNDIELDSTGDLSVEPLPSTTMENELKDGVPQNNSEVTVESQMENECQIKISPNELLGSIFVAAEEPDKAAEFNETTCASEVAAGSVNLVKEDSDMELHGLTVLQLEVKEEEPVTSNLKDENATDKVVEVENVLPELEESALLPVQEESRGEEAELVEVYKPEEPQLEERSHVEAPTETEKVYDAYLLGDANTSPPQSIGAPVPSLKSMEVTDDTKESSLEEQVSEYEVPKVEELIPEQTCNHGTPSPNVDALENMFEQLPPKEKDETQELEEKIDKERIVDSSCGADVVERKVMEVTPASEQDYTLHDVNGSALAESKENDNLLKENEKLREMLQKLIAAGNEQLNVISNLNGRVKDLEKKLTKNKKMGMRRKRTAARRSHCVKTDEN